MLFKFRNDHLTQRPWWPFFKKWAKTICALTGATRGPHIIKPIWSNQRLWNLLTSCSFCYLCFSAVHIILTTTVIFFVYFSFLFGHLLFFRKVQQEKGELFTLWTKWWEFCMENFSVWYDWTNEWNCLSEI